MEFKCDGYVRKICYCLVESFILVYLKCGFFWFDDLILLIWGKLLYVLSYCFDEMLIVIYIGILNLFSSIYD